VEGRFKQTISRTAVLCCNKPLSKNASVHDLLVKLRTLLGMGERYVRTAASLLEL
jgi:hypothetical protein